MYIACPRCRSRDLSKSNRKKLVDVFMRVLRMKPLRCLDCRKRFFVYREVADSVSRARVRRERRYKRSASKSSAVV